MPPRALGAFNKSQAKGVAHTSQYPRLMLDNAGAPYSPAPIVRRNPICYTLEKATGHTKIRKRRNGTRLMSYEEWQQASADFQSALSPTNSTEGQQVLLPRPYYVDYPYRNLEAYEHIFDDGELDTGRQLQPVRYGYAESEHVPKDTHPRKNLDWCEPGRGSSNTKNAIFDWASTGTSYDIHVGRLCYGQIQQIRENAGINATKVAQRQRDEADRLRRKVIADKKKHEDALIVISAPPPLPTEEEEKEEEDADDTGREVDSHNGEFNINHASCSELRMKQRSNTNVADLFMRSMGQP